MNTTLFGIGLACVIAALVGGGLRAAGFEFPIIASLRRQVLLAALGGILIIVSGALIPRSGMSPLEVGWNYQGHDYLNVESNDAARCASACQKDPRCRAMTFVDQGGSRGICWLKDSVPTMTPNAGMTSAVKLAR